MSPNYRVYIPKEQISSYDSRILGALAESLEPVKGNFISFASNLIAKHAGKFIPPIFRGIGSKINDLLNNDKAKCEE
ncbi:MAG: hypothetical protein FWC09_03595 [Lachnospiraceae bacterium]|nr:hypothetical protein [Lachnospiraceae bacterium]